MNILIVEDEVLLAMELENELLDAGHRVVGEAMSSDEAIRLAEERKPDFAFVDIHLLDGPTGIKVGQHLAAVGVSYVFMTGNLKKVPDDFAGAIGVIEKPYSVNGLRNAVSYLERLVLGETAAIGPPPSLIMPSTESGALTQRA